MSNELTDREFWVNYWESKTDLAFAVPPTYAFHQLFKKLLAEKPIKTAIELGGFPGYYAIFLKKYFNVDASLFDFYVHQPILKEVLAANQLQPHDIPVIEGDLFQFEPTRQYDLVLSCGLIEHFQDTKDIISRHLGFLQPGGTLLITLPNFTGVNGWVQRTYDIDNYYKHNISSMNPALLAEYCRQLGLQQVEAYYYGHFSIWLENRKQQSPLTNGFLRALWVVGKLFTKVVPVESKSLSPYIVVKAVKR